MRAWLLALTAGCGGGSPPPETTAPGETNCYDYGAGARCVVDTCCDGQSCWYQASDGTRWPCGGSRVCTEAEAAPARDWCELAATTRPTFDSPCRWVGTWQIVTSWCGVFEIDDVTRLYEDTLVEIAEREGGGCDVTVRWVHRSGCRAVEDWSISSDAVLTPSEMEVVLHGISDCEPDLGCILGDHLTEIQCVEGDREGTVTAELEESPEGDLTLTGCWHPDVLPLCGDPLGITLTKAPATP